MNNLEEINCKGDDMSSSKIIVIKEDSTSKCVNHDVSTVLYFLNTCGIICDNLQELNGIIVQREILLSDAIYDKLKPDIHKLKPILSSTTFTSMQKNADKTQQWPLINLIRQILRKYNYLLLPKRICDGYTKDGVKKYKRLFEVKLVPPLKIPT